MSAVVFASTAGPIVASTDCAAADVSLPGDRIRVSFDPATVQTAYDAGAFDLDAMFPGGDVPGLADGAPVVLELRLADEPASLLAESSREPGVLLGDLVALTDTGRHEHLLLDASSWQITAAVQRRPDGATVHHTTLHDGRPAAGPA